MHISLDEAYPEDSVQGNAEGEMQHEQVIEVIPRTQEAMLFETKRYRIS